MTCLKCTGLAVEVVEQDEEGEYCECLKCLNCGMRVYAVKTGKSIEVTKGELYD